MAWLAFCFDEDNSHHLPGDPYLSIHFLVQGIINETEQAAIILFHDLLDLNKLEMRKAAVPLV